MLFVVSQVKTGARVHTLGCNSMDVALSEYEVVIALDLDLVAVFGIEQHHVTGFDRSDARTNRYHLGPGEPLGYLGGSRYQDARSRPALTFSLGHLHQDPIGEHGDRLLAGEAGTMRRGGKRDQGHCGRRSGR